MDDICCLGIDSAVRDSSHPAVWTLDHHLRVLLTQQTFGFVMAPLSLQNLALRLAQLTAGYSEREWKENVQNVIIEI